MVKNAFYFTFFYFKLFPFSLYLRFCFEALLMYRNGFIGKDSVNFKIYDVRTCKTNNFNTHIAQYLVKERQSDNEIWSVNSI